nr:MAG TPA: hypothetical protein [Caudoviricetes sp.]
MAPWSCARTRGHPIGPRGDVGHQQYKTNPPLVPVMWKCSTKGGIRNRKPKRVWSCRPGRSFSPG